MNTFFSEVLTKLALSIDNVGEKVTLYGMIGIQIEGHKGIVDFCNDYVIVKFKREKIRICGERLTLKEISKDEIFVNGKIKSLGVVDD